MNAIGKFFGFGTGVETRSGSVDSAGGNSPLPGVMPPVRTSLDVSWREALKVSAFARSMDEINTMMSSMRPTVRDNAGTLLDPTSRQYPSIVARPNLDMDYEEFVQLAVNDLMLHGEFFWLRVGDPQTVNLIPTSPEEMTVVRMRKPDGTWGPLIYGHMGKEVPRSRIIHRKHTAITGEARGIGPRHLAQAELRAAITLRDFQADWFDAGIPSGTLNTETHLNESQAQELQTRWNNFLASNRGRSVILSSGLTYNALHLKPAEAQMLEVQDSIDRPPHRPHLRHTSIRPAGPRWHRVPHVPEPRTVDAAVPHHHPGEVHEQRRIRTVAADLSRPARRAGRERPTAHGLEDQGRGRHRQRQQPHPHPERTPRPRRPRGSPRR